MIKKMREGFRLSLQQEHLWLAQQREDSSAFISKSVALLEGTLKREKLDRAIEKLILGHEILRTTFYCLPWMTIPGQVVMESNLAIRQDYDLTGRSPEEQAMKVETIFHQRKPE